MEKWDGGRGYLLWKSPCFLSSAGTEKTHPSASPVHTKQTLATADACNHQGLSATSHFSCYPESELSVHKDSSSSDGLLQATGLGLPLPKNQEINSRVCTGPSWHLYHRKLYLNVCGCDLQIQVWAQSDYYCKPVTKQYLQATRDSKAHLLLRATRWVTLRDQTLTWLILWTIEYLSPTWWSACLIDFFTWLFTF